VQPLRPAIDQVCTEIESTPALVILAFGGYPMGLSSTFLSVIIPTLSVCGQLQNNS
jgi:hypothetical protein